MTLTLAKILSYLKGVGTKDLFEFANDLNEFLTNAAAKAEIGAWVLLASALIAVFAVGLFGYKLVKPLASLLMGYVGYFIGAEIYSAVIKQHFESCPQWVLYVVGGVFAALFIFLGFVKFSYVWFALAAVGGYVAVSFYSNGNLILALGGALLAGFLTVTLVRTAVILMTSAGCGFLSIGLLSGLLPKVDAFRPNACNWAAIGLMAMMFFIFATFQFVTNRRRKEYLE